MLVFWRNGYHATSMPDLCAAMGIDVKSLYAAFGSKEKLYVEAVDLYMKASNDLLWAHLKTGGKEGIRELLLATSQVMTDSGSHPVGCWITMAQIDEDMPPPVAATIRKARYDWLGVVRAHLEAAISKGELDTSADLDALTRFYVGIVQAIGVQAHDGAKQAEMDGLVGIAMANWPLSTA
ncbi:MAG: TetR/AcrR family transcriptional regulator [Rhizobiaceae bacterium]|nr:TetR/AcrR family transcriptional regulator [Rhizobiaceae bacterium]